MFSNGIGTSATFNSPSGVAVDASGNVFVADRSNRIRKITPGGVVSTLAGNGTAAFADGTGTGAKFDFPVGVAVYVNGDVLVADTNNLRIRKVTPGGVVTTLAGSGSAAFADGTGAAASFYAPYAVAADTSGNVFVGDSARIRKVNPLGVVSTLAGFCVVPSRGSGCIGGFSNGVGTNALFGNLFGVAVDANGYVVVADEGNSRIRKVSSGGVVTTPAFADGTGTVSAVFYPKSVAIDASGN